MVVFLLYDICFFGYGSKLLGLGINDLMMSLLDMCQLLVFLAKFLILENYMFSSWFYHNTFLVCNKRVGRSEGTRLNSSHVSQSRMPSSA